jgi:hypothetical protein
MGFDVCKGGHEAFSGYDSTCQNFARFNGYYHPMTIAELNMHMGYAVLHPVDSDTPIGDGGVSSHVFIVVILVQ